MGVSSQIDLGGNTLIVKDIQVGANAAGQSGTALSSTELGFLDTVTATSGVVASKAVIANSSGTVPYKPVVIRHTTGATRTLDGTTDCGAQVFLDKADGVVITLPAATVGCSYDFIVVTSVTSNAYKLSTATQGTEFFDGSYLSHDIDGTGVVGVIFTGDGSTHDNFSMNGSTTGGLAGATLRVTCSKANTWTVSGHNRASGTVATSFATS